MNVGAGEADRNVMCDARAFLAFNGLFWAGYFLVLTAFRAIFLRAIEADALGWRALVVVGVFLITGLAHIALRHSDVHGPRLVLLALATAPLTGALHVLTNMAVFNVLGGAPLLGTFAEHFLDLYAGMFWTHVGWAGAYAGWATAGEMRRQTDRASAAEALAREAQIRMLQYQLNPHFLFNSLNAISALVLDGRAADAESMLTRLASFLRYALECDPAVKVPLREELAAQAQYLGVEQVRFPDKLRVEVKTGAGLENALAPSLILQPLIENAIKYAVAPSRGPTAIRLSATAENDKLVLLVEDDGPQGANVSTVRPGPGVGLTNTRRRLEVLYGHAASLEALRKPAGGFSARMAFPLEYAS